MVSHDREIMVTDFGLVMTDHEAPITKAGAIMGTLRYLSPEQALGGRVPVDHRTDIYSLGATLYELLALQPLFCASDDKQLLAAVIGQEPRRPSELNPTVPADLETVCLKALEKLPENRYHTAKDLAEDLAAFVEDRPISARRPPVRVRAARFIRRHVVGLLVGACLVIFAGGGVVAVGGHRKARVAEKVNELISQGLVLQQEQRWDEAAAAYRAATELDPRNVRALGNLAIIRKEQFNTQAQRDPLLLEEANAYCDAALAVAPGHAGIWNVKGVVLKKLGRLEESAGAYRTALSSETVEPEMRIAIHNNLAEAQWLMGDHDAAEANVRAAAQIAEATGTPAWFAWQDLAALELAYGNPEAAEYVRKGFEAKGGSHWRLHVTRARVCLEIEETKDVERAVRDVYAALEHGPADPRIERTAAIALLRANSFEEAAEHARKAIELGDVPSYAYLVLSIAEARLGQNEQGREHYRAAIDSWPTELDEGQYLVSTEQGMLWLDTRWQLQEWVEEAQVLLHEDDRR
jgi:tetratricopeptide (TPR) repeat protein